MMRKLIGGALGLVAVASVVAIERSPAASADARPVDGQGRRELRSEHVGSFFVPDNLAAGEPLDTPTSAEIAGVTTDGRLLYVDAWPSGWGPSTSTIPLRHSRSAPCSSPACRRVWPCTGGGCSCQS